MVIKLLIITNIPAPYRIPFFDLLNKHQYKLHIIFTESRKLAEKRWFEIYPMNFSHVFLENRKFKFLSILWEINRNKPAVIVAGGFGLYSLVAAFYGFIVRRPVLLWSAETVVAEKFRGVSLISKLVRLLIFKLVYGFLAYGPPAAKYLLKKKVPAQYIKVINNPTDLSVHDNILVRSLIGKPIITTVIRLEESKNPTAVFNVAQILKKRGIEPLFILLGEGSLKTKLKALGLNMKLKNVVIKGNVSRKEVMMFYNKSWIYFHPVHYDQWPHAINEALSYELPIVCTNNCGIPDSLVENGKSGFVHKVNDLYGMADSLERLIKDKKLNFKFGREGKRRIEEISCENTAIIFSNSVKRAYLALTL